jgi:hypothetical protein
MTVGSSSRSSQRTTAKPAFSVRAQGTPVHRGLPWGLEHATDEWELCASTGFIVLKRELLSLRMAKTDDSTMLVSHGQLVLKPIAFDGEKYGRS